MITASICGVLILPKFARPTPKVGAKLGIEETILSGIGIKPVTRPKSVVAKIPIKIEPGTRRAINKAVTKKPKIVNQVVGTVNDPNSTNEDLLATTIPPPFKPTKAIKIPIPAAIASLRSCGIASITISRILNNESNVKITEATTTPAIAVCHGIPIVKTTE